MNEPDLGDWVVEAQGLHKHYPGVLAVNGVDLSVARGQCLGLLGPNGAGKTTTIEMLVGLTPPDAGSIRLFGRSYQQHGNELRQDVGVQLQETRLPEKLTCFEVLRMFRSFYDNGRDPDEVLELVELTPKRNARTRLLSGGQHQRLTLGCALVSRPRLLFLDEPTTGLDPQARRRVWEIVKAFKGEGGTVLLTTHYMDEAEKLSDELVILDHGKIIAEGTPRSIIEGLGADSIVELTFAESTSVTLRDQVRSSLTALQSIVGAKDTQNGVRLTVQQLHTTLPEVFSRVRESEVVLDDLHTHRPNLEDVFVTLTGRQLRE